MQIQISDSAGASNIALVRYQVTDDAGVNIGQQTALTIWLSDVATGLGLTATTASGAVAAGSTAGQQLVTQGQAVYYQKGTVRTAPPAPGDIQLGTLAFTPGGKVGAGWLPAATGGYSTSYEFINPSGPVAANAVMWTITGLPVGSMVPCITWGTGPAGRSAAAPFSLYDGNTLLASVAVDQSVSPSGVTINSVAFKNLSAVTLKSGVLRVLLTETPTGAVVADAVAAQWGGAGADLGDVTSKKCKKVLTDAFGVYVLSITDSGKTGFYPCASVPGANRVVVGAQLRTASYG